MGGIKGFAGQVFNEEGAWQVEGSACHALFPLHRSEDSFKQYFSEMPWVAVPYADEARRSRLNRLYGIQGRRGHTEAQISFLPPPLLLSICNVSSCLTKPRKQQSKAQCPRQSRFMFLLSTNSHSYHLPGRLLVETGLP